MTFKEAAFQDIGNTFFNEDEFGEWHTLSGKRMKVVVDATEVEERAKKSFLHSKADGVYEDNLLIYVPRKSFGEQPARGRELTFDGLRYRVEDCRDEGGVYSIQLGRVVS